MHHFLVAAVSHLPCRGVLVLFVFQANVRSALI